MRNKLNQKWKELPWNEKIQWLIFILLIWLFAIEAFKFASEPANIIVNNYETKRQIIDEEVGEESGNVVAKPVYGDATPQEVIRRVAKEEGFQEIEALIGIGYCESRLVVSEKVDGKFKNYAVNPTNKSYDRGWFQISRRWHPETTDECAYDLECSTREAIRIQRKDGWNAWACYKKYGL